MRKIVLTVVAVAFVLSCGEEKGKAPPEGLGTLSVAAALSPSEVRANLYGVKFEVRKLNAAGEVVSIVTTTIAPFETEDYPGTPYSGHAFADALFVLPPA